MTSKRSPEDSDTSTTVVEDSFVARTSDTHRAKRTRGHSIDGGELTVVPSATSINSPGSSDDSPIARMDRRSSSLPCGPAVALMHHRLANEGAARALVARARFKAAIERVYEQNKNATSSPDADSAELDLCKTCANLQLTCADFTCSPGDDDRVPKDRQDDHAFTMGTLQSICYRALSCQLCRLIIKAAHQQLPSATSAKGEPTEGDGPPQGLNAVCRLSWEIDGMAVSQPTEGDGEPETIEACPKTRRLLVHWSDDRLEDYYLIMMATSETDQTDFLGRPVATSREAKEHLIKRWLALCKSGHGPGCHGPTSPEDDERFDELQRGPYFGVIDVEEMCFKALPRNAEYVTLSYYWGAKTSRKRFCTTRKTVLALKERNNLSEHFDDLPETIRESIELVRELGLRYLWVDCLCLVTDLNDAWERNAMVMDLVYGRANLTICAADGDNAEAGLWALNHQDEIDDATKQCVAQYSPDLQLLARFPSEVLVGRSKWSSRAWAFQERLFSKRCLIFCGGRMFLECCTTTFSEDIDLESTVTGRSLDFDHSHKKDWRYASGDIVRSYLDSVAHYTSMELPRVTEKLEAFEPIGKLIFERLGGQLVYGLPNSHFDWALLWGPLDGKLRDTRESKHSFPSWSWCGWGGPIAYDDWNVDDCMEDLHDWLVNHTWITWYIRDGNGILRLVWDAKRHRPRDFGIDERWRGYRSSKADCIGYDLYGRKIPKRWIGHPRTEFKRALPDFPVQVQTWPLGESSSQLAARTEDLTLLQFHTWSAYFWLEPATHTSGACVLDRTKREHDRHALCRYRILDASRNWVGETKVSSRWRFDAERPQPFIAISEAKWAATADDESSQPDGPYADSWKQSWPFYNVLLLDYNADDDTAGDWRHKIAYRVGLGKVLQDAFENGVTDEQRTSKKWREIVMG